MTETEALINQIPAVKTAVTTWQAGTENTGTFNITDQDLTVYSADTRRTLQDTLVTASHEAGYVLEWRRDHPNSVVRFTWHRQE